MPKPFMTIELQGLRRLRAKLGLLTKVEKKALQVEVRRALVNIERGAKKKVRIDRGGLRRSVTHQLDADKLGGRAGTNSVYGPATEFGRRPGSFPPIEPIKEWAVRKGMDEGAAFPIARKIALEGTRPAPFLFPAFEEERPVFVRRAVRKIEDAHKRLARGSTTTSPDVDDGL